MSDFLARKLRTYFVRMDLDHDGLMTKNDFAELTRIFIERNKLDEAKRKRQEDHLHKVWLMLSHGDEGATLNEDTFVDNMLKEVQDPSFTEKMSASLHNWFDAIDTDNDGLIELDEFIVFFDIIGVDKNLIQTTFTAIDADGDGTISLDEYTAFILAFYTSHDEGHPSKWLMGPLV